MLNPVHSTRDLAPSPDALAPHTWTASAEPLSWQTVAAYRDRAVRLHEVRIEQIDDGVMRVVDRWGSHAAVVETLVNERREREWRSLSHLVLEADAIAYDYANEIARYHEGVRATHPIGLADPVGRLKPQVARPLPTARPRPLRVRPGRRVALLAAA
jgi:hypothetical protein